MLKLKMPDRINLAAVLLGERIGDLGVALYASAGVADINIRMHVSLPTPAAELVASYCGCWCEIHLPVSKVRSSLVIIARRSVSHALAGVRV